MMHNWKLKQGMILAVVLTLLSAGVGCRTTKTATTTRPSPGAPLGKSQVEANYLEGSSLLMRGAYPEAINAFSAVVAESPGHAAAQFALARTLLIVKRFDDAVPHARAALQADPENFWYYYLLKEVYVGQGDYRQAIDIQQQAVAHFPLNAEARLDLASLFLQNRQPDQATKTLATRPDVSYNQSQEQERFDILLRSRSTAAALESCNRLIMLDPFNPDYRIEQYHLYTLLNQPDSAMAVLESMLKIDPQNGFALLTLADYYRIKGDQIRSDSFLFAAFRNPDLDPVQKISLIGTLRSQVTPQESKPQLERISALIRILLEVHPQSSAALELQGDVMVQSNRPDSARIYYRKALELAPTQERSWNALMAASFRIEDYTALYKDSGNALDYFPNEKQYLFFHGLACAFTNDLEEGRSNLEKILRISEEQSGMKAEVTAILGRITELEGNPAEAEKLYKEALVLQPLNVFAHFLYALSLSEKPDKIKEATSQAQMAAATQGALPPFQHLYGWLLYRQGKYADALIWLQLAAISPQPIYLEHYGDVLFKEGKMQEAKDAWNQALVEGGHFDLQKKLQP